MPLQDTDPVTTPHHTGAATGKSTLGDCATLLILRDTEYPRALIDLTNTATRSIFIVQFQFRAPFRPGRHMADLLAALRAAADRHVSIRLLLNHPHPTKRLGPGHGRLYDALDHPSILIRHAPNTRILHTKLFTADDRVTVLGSHNLSEASFNTSRNLSVLIDSRSFAQRVTTAYAPLWAESSHGTP